MGCLELMVEVPLYRLGSEDARSAQAARVRGLLREAAGSRGTREPPPYRGVAAAAEVLSAPRKWPKGSGRGPFKRQPHPLGPPPAPAGLARLGWRWEPRVANRRHWADGLDGRTQVGVGSRG